ncbi:MAG TPA: serine hydrolase [Myxococcota bacterium]|nr:serine hydrolase [Myxococcota bacterium]
MSDRVKLKNRLGHIVQQAIAERVATACSLFVGFAHEDTASDILVHGGFTGAKRPVDDDTIYDLASLTKILGTSLSVAHAISRGRMALADKPFSSWPEISVRDLLAHRTGLPAHRKFYEELELSPRDFVKNQKRVFDHLLTMKTTPNGKRLYSDVGFMALGFLLEEVFKKPLFLIFQDTWTDLCTDTQFIKFSSNSSVEAEELKLIAPTGTPCMGGILVHDANCQFLDGLAGHAGLFGNLSSVKRIGQWFLRAKKAPTHETAMMIQRFADEGLGFDKPILRGSTTRTFSKRAFGHFGYTGTSLWIEPEAHKSNGIIVALLTNRVNCSEKPDGIFWLRLAVHRAVSLNTVG